MAQDAGNRGTVVANAGRLLGFARRNGIPVVLARIAFRPDHAGVIQNYPIFQHVVAGKAKVDGSWGVEFHEGLGPLPGEFIIKHSRVNAFYGLQLEKVLRRLKAERLIVAGVATNSVVLTSLANAADVGYDVVTDACSSGRQDPHESSLEDIELVADGVLLERLGKLTAEQK